MGHGPERTCIGCRNVFAKDKVVRVAAGPTGVVVDLREKLPGRGAYICPTPACIGKALSREKLSRALRTTVRIPPAAEFSAMVESAVVEKIRFLMAMAGKARKLAVGYSAVHDGLEKGRIGALFYARDISDGTKEKLLHSGAAADIRQATLFSRDELGRMLDRQLVGVVGIEDRGFSDALWNEVERLKNLINNGQ